MSNRGFADSDILTSYNVAGLDANGKHTAVILCRGFAYINNMKYRVESCIDSRDGSTRNNLMIPYRIYGYKISGKYPTDRQYNQIHHQSQITMLKITYTPMMKFVLGHGLMGSLCIEKCLIWERYLIIQLKRLHIIYLI